MQLAQPAAGAPRGSLPAPGFAAILVVVLSLFATGCGGEKPAAPIVQASTPPQPDPQVLREQTEALCSACHAMPMPDTFPRAAWPDEVEQGLRFYADSGRHDLKAPPKEFINSVFQRDAPPRVLVAPPFPNGNPNRVVFEQQPLGPTAAAAAIAGLRFVPERGWLVATDMRSGNVSGLNPREAGGNATLLATLSNTAHVEPCDLDGDGVQDFVAADLGSFLPEDHHDGAVVWIRSVGDKFESQTLDQDLGRVADVQPADVNGDGRLDLIVAEFGWRTTGRILWLEQLPGEEGQLKFERHVIDDRHGTIHVPVADLDGDGDLDFVALIAQEHEVVDAFFNDGKGTFRRERIFDAQDPSYGSSGIELIDFDRDGDLDVLMSNGDTFDSQFLKPSHGIRWLENQGAFPYVVHPVTKMPGVLRARAADFDGDGDLDIAAVAFVQPVMGKRALLSTFDSIVWFEQAGAESFERHSLETGNFTHAALEIGDFNGDGRPDLAVGSFMWPGSAPGPVASIWWNRGHKGEAKAE
jgi:hypothetical protein